MLKLFAFANAFRGQNMNKWWSFPHKNPPEMRGSAFSHDRGTISNGDESGFSYWGMLHYPQCRLPPSRMFWMGAHHRISGVPLFTGKSEFFNRIRIVGPHCARRDEARICDMSCNPLHMGWGGLVKLHILRGVIYEMKNESTEKRYFLWRWK